jgi:hypothetical protein
MPFSHSLVPHLALIRGVQAIEHENEMAAQVFNGGNHSDFP